MENKLKAIFLNRGIKNISNPCSLDSLTLLVNEIRSEGSSFIFKADGERSSDSDGIYTFLISGGPVKELIRLDTNNLLEGFAGVIIEYSQKIWGI